MSLLDAISFLLPNPVSTDDVQVLRRRTVLDPARVPDAVLLDSGSHRPRGLLDHYPVQTRFFLMPRFGRARALAPDPLTPNARRLLMPRSQPTSVPRIVAARLLTSAPEASLKLASRRVVVATRTTSVVAAALDHLVPHSRLGCYLGNVHNAGRTNVFAFAADGLGAVAKIVTEADGQDRTAHEAHMLRSLESEPRLQGTVPKVLAEPAFHLGSVIITDGFEGDPCPTYLTDGIRAWLSQCISTDTVSAIDAIAPMTCEQLQSIGPDVARSVVTARLALEGVRVRRTIVNGDFAPWNILLKDGRVQVFDWEHGTLAGAPEWDALHFTVQTGVTVGKWDNQRLVSELETILRAGTPHYPTANAYRAVAVLSLADLVVRSTRRGEDSQARLFADVAMRTATSL